MKLGLGLRKKFNRLSDLVVHGLAQTPGFHEAVSSFRPRDKVFNEAYETRVWNSDESRSGRGSELGATASLRQYLPDLFRRLEVRVFLDAPCGDWNWMSRVEFDGVRYIGMDVVSAVVERNRQAYSRPGIEFIHADLTKDDLPRADLVMCRDCLIHLSFQDIIAVLSNFRRSGASWLLATNSPDVTENLNQLTGLKLRHLNLCVPPFGFPPPLEARKDHYPDMPFQISLWRLSDLPDLSR